MAKPTEPIGSTGRQILEHSAHTAVTAVASMLAGRFLRLLQTYWAPIITLVITQSSLGSTLAVSWQRFVGTAAGAAIGAMVATYFGPHMLSLQGYDTIRVVSSNWSRKERCKPRIKVRGHTWRR